MTPEHFQSLMELSTHYTPMTWQECDRLLVTRLTRVEYARLMALWRSERPNEDDPYQW